MIHTFPWRVAAHSIRAVPLPDIRILSAYAEEHELPFHMHVCEQRVELEECRSEYGDHARRATYQ